jgi:seryl-tRNA synthetase
VTQSESENPKPVAAPLPTSWTAYCRCTRTGPRVRSVYARVTTREPQCVANFATTQHSKRINALQKQIGLHKRAKEEDQAAVLVQEKAELDRAVVGLKTAEVDRERELRKLAGTIGNLVHESVPVSMTEDDNVEVAKWHPDGPNASPQKRTDILSHHEVMYRLDILDQERGAKVAGHRGYFLMNDGVDLNQALISYGLDFLRSKSYKKIMTPFMMRRGLMAKTAQLEEFDENLYKVEGEAEEGATPEDEKYLIATSEQPLSGLHSDEWFDDPTNQLPLRWVAACFSYSIAVNADLQVCRLLDMLPKRGRQAWPGNMGRLPRAPVREGRAGAHPSHADLDGLNSAQFCITDPASSEEFYQSLKLPYHVVAIVSGALNNAAAKKYDLEAWFPFQGEYKELVSVSNCTDYRGPGSCQVCVC